MPFELIKCSRAFRISAWRSSGHDVHSGMFKDDSQTSYCQDYGPLEDSED